MRIIQLPSSIDGFTHAKVTREISNPGESIYIDILYGTMVGGKFVASKSGSVGRFNIGDEEYTDLVEVVKAKPGRVASRPNTDFWPSDVDAHLEEDPAIRKVRIDARSPTR